MSRLNWNSETPTSFATALRRSMCGMQLPTDIEPPGGLSTVKLT